MTSENVAKVAVLWRGSREARERADLGRYAVIIDSLRGAGLDAEPAIYLDEEAPAVRAQLSDVDAVLVWVNPDADEGDRSRLDPLLREAASRGVWVSAHPDVILKMGTKEVLVRTGDMTWGCDCHLYRSLAELRAALPQRLADGEARVLKQYRGNGGRGVYRVALQSPTVSKAIDTDTIVVVQHALAGSLAEGMRLGDFIDRLEAYFDGEGRIIDQAYQARLGDGMIRCYMVHDEVAGFGQQYVTALLPSAAGASPSPRIMSDAHKPAFQRLRKQLEEAWIPELQQRLDIRRDQLPAIWDADFLYGPTDMQGEDTYVLCEINVSCVFPFPDPALPALTRATVRAANNAKRSRRT